MEDEDGQAEQQDAEHGHLSGTVRSWREVVNKMFPTCLVPRSRMSPSGGAQRP
jgi:hypothetical protein